MRHQVSRNYSNAWQLEKDIKDLPEEERIKLGYEASEMVYAQFISGKRVHYLRSSNSADSYVAIFFPRNLIKSVKYS